MSEFKLIRGSITEKFANSRAKVQIYGGGFANGKTAAACVLKALKVAQEYPGSNILIARATYPKLNDTIRKEFFKWCPDVWIKSFSKAENTCILKNGTTINFRYIQQQARGGADSSSNLLSATYDLIIVDQMEDPEISHKDFTDLLGRLRGMAGYIGEDPTMPRSGPRWIVLTCNPTGNWFYQKIVRPMHQYAQSGVVSDDLLCWRDPITATPLMGDDNKPQLMAELFEGSTYENADNLEHDFIQALEGSYTGQMRERYLLGRWAAFEGLVYPTVTQELHGIRRDAILEYLQSVDALTPAHLFEGYDHGLSVPGCYLMGFEDRRGNFFIVDGHYEVLEGTDPWVAVIQQKRIEHLMTSAPDLAVEADPAIFRKTGTMRKTIGATVARMMEDEGLRVQRGNNDFQAGREKLVKWMAVDKRHPHPVLKRVGAPHFYIATELLFWWDEISNYYWKKNTSGEWTDTPQDKNDHAMDCMRYMATRLQEPFLYSPVTQHDLRMYQWHEMNDPTMRAAGQYR